MMFGIKVDRYNEGIHHARMVLASGASADVFEHMPVGWSDAFANGVGSQLDAFPALLARLRSQGYDEFRYRKEKLCAIHSFIHTTAIVVGLSDLAYEHRYCFEHRNDAILALRRWKVERHPPGLWTKVKGLLDSEPIDVLNPGFMTKLNR